MLFLGTVFIDVFKADLLSPVYFAIFIFVIFEIFESFFNELEDMWELFLVLDDKLQSF